MESLSWLIRALLYPLLFCSCLALVKLPRGVTIPAVFVFGDSIVDTGNNNNLLTIVKSNFPPYGIDLPNGKATGRFSNGKTPSDLIAEEVGVKEFLPPYLDPTLQTDDLVTGVCFASGGAGFDHLTSELALVKSLSDQLRMFQEYQMKLNATIGSNRTSIIVSNSLYIVAAGTDDLANTYYDDSLVINIRKQQYNVSAYTDLMTTSATKIFHDLYRLGARKIGVLGLPPIGCLPFERTLFGGLLRDCSNRCNEAAELFNSKLQSEIEALNASISNLRLSYIDAYYSLLDMINNTEKYGFGIGDRGCCGTGLFEVSFLCLDMLTCKNASNYIFWDGYHPTEKAYRILVQELIHNLVRSLYWY